MGDSIAEAQRWYDDVRSPAEKAIIAEVERRAPWYGVDPIKSRDLIELGRYMDPKKFESAEAYVTALLGALEQLYKPKE